MRGYINIEVSMYNIDCTIEEAIGRIKKALSAEFPEEFNGDIEIELIESAVPRSEK